MFNVCDKHHKLVIMLPLLSGICKYLFASLIFYTSNVKNDNGYCENIIKTIMLIIYDQF